ncbi:hypothetical protein OTSGILL_0660 [Orientia tsutsugamushi str. Gilliam]|uniref:Uncharacterized protein n=1 Tax=Orientia tsutsugamushi str. Gilliam TaxID=1359184 RepID=A0A0F3MCX3_ORITS|nr:hypothetical protein OTSGILL_0769 [Orientia tsutsugamushi str. Gilliam]KJV53575.1 hypothetical protein OTSGILL_0660 [Orientia tsutsugamushi str. Gilliam]SPR07767.1 Uncharacterised protein [Orientia tsutsugamushi str. Gilliam]SPR11488.1 Uncharacterised protein [Orientia tsutsugamushi str. Gilliam]
MKEEKLTQIAVDDRLIQGYYTFYYVNTMQWHYKMIKNQKLIQY